MRDALRWVLTLITCPPTLVRTRVAAWAGENLGVASGARLRLSLKELLGALEEIPMSPSSRDFSATTYALTSSRLATNPLATNARGRRRAKSLVMRTLFDCNITNSNWEIVLLHYRRCVGKDQIDPYPGV